MDTALKFVSEQTGLALLLLGVGILVAAWLPIQLGTFSLQPPTTSGKIVLSAVGALVVFLGLYLFLEAAPGGPVLKPTIIDHTTHVVLHGNEAPCRAGQCRVRYFITGEFRTPPFSEARFVDRIKTGGRIDSFETVPPYDNLIPNQFPGNPTFLQFAIKPQKPGGRVLVAQAELTLLNVLSPERGKIGAHLPYYTRKATMIVDFRALGFKPTKQVKGHIETPVEGGVQRTGFIYPTRLDFSGGLVISLQASDIPAESSFVLTWGDP
ncbi:MAG: hypothetical protein KIT25_06995 [Enhydrobacter sp.]|nr:MAG: hypothetical protein KIT25_06995 [Enhydrobacter sp.]